MEFSVGLKDKMISQSSPPWAALHTDIWNTFARDQLAVDMLDWFFFHSYNHYIYTYVY